MLNYTDTEIQEIVQEIMKKDVIVTPVGNHELKRHLVYKITDNGNEIGIFKLYYKVNRWNREVGTLKLFEGTDIKAPKIIDFGRLDNNTEWLIIEYIEGELLKDVKSKITFENLQEIYEEIGEQLGKIHGIKSFDFFGSFDENGESIDNVKDFLTWLKRDVDSIIKELFNQSLKEYELHRECAEMVKGLLPMAADVKEAHLCNGDFGDRNTLVKMVDGRWVLSALIDFEQAYPYDKDRDIIDYYYTLHEENIKLAEAFKSGYEKHMKFSSDLEKKKMLYELKAGLSICSWANVQAPDYYIEGVKILEKYAAKK